MRKNIEDPPPFEEVMRCLLLRHTETLLSHVPSDRACKVCTATQTGGVFPKMLMDSRNAACVHGVTGSRTIASRARKKLLSFGDARFGSHIYEMGVADFMQRHMGEYDAVFYIPHIRALDQPRAVEREKCHLHHLVCRCVGALAPGGVLVLVLINPSTHRTRVFRDELLRWTRHALDFTGAALSEERELPLPDLEEDPLAVGEREIWRSCVLIVARKGDDVVE